MALQHTDSPLPPRWASRSTNVTDTPRSARLAAASSPAIPADHDHHWAFMHDGTSLDSDGGGAGRRTLSQRSAIHLRQPLRAGQTGQTQRNGASIVLYR